MVEPSKRWNTFYEANVDPWQGPPVSMVEKYIETLARGTVADLAAGNGRDTCYMASHGAEVYAYDVSKVALKLLMEKAALMKANARVHTKVQDLRSFKSDRTVDHVVSSFTLHFLAPPEGEQFVKEIQSMTHPGGLNILTDFNDPFPTETEPQFYPGLTGLKRYYKGWKILEEGETQRTTRQLDEKGKPYQKTVFEFVARKQP